MNDEQSKKPYRLGLALSGGGSKGFGHVGVFQYLKDCKLEPDIIVGTSAGALMGAFYADGFSPKEICQLFVEHEFSDFTELQIPKAGLLDARKFKKFLLQTFRAKTFEELRIPLKIIATNLDHGVSHEFSSGSLVDAIMASCSIPIIFNPVKINGVHYVDGGLFRNFPVAEIREECERVIGVNVSPLMPKKYKQTLYSIAERSYHYMFKANSVEDRDLCDVLIETTEIGKFSTFDLDNIYRIFHLGYDAAAHAVSEFIEKNSEDKLINTIERT